MQAVLDYILNVLVASLIHLSILIVPILILGLIMHLVSKQLEKKTVELIGMKGYLYLFGWIGTSIHELGHLVFALIFGHHVSNVKLFSLDSKNPEMGHVQHSFNKKNWYQNIGNFFIGIGPILLGGISLFIVGFLLLDINFFKVINNSIDLATPSIFEVTKNVLTSVFDSMMNLIQQILQNNESPWWKFLLFFYLLFSIGGSISLSKSDIKGSFSGLMLFVLLVFIFNLTTFWIGNFATHIFVSFSNLITGFYLMLLISILFNSFFLLLLTIITLTIPIKAVKKNQK